MKLLIDIGNSRLKWATSQPHQLPQAEYLDYRQTQAFNHLQACWAKLSQPEQIALSCVANQHIADQVIELAQTLWPTIDILRPVASATALGVSNAYQQPEKLGIDRWLALIAAHHHYPGACCIVDCGTAITLDFIDSFGQHQGGLISPGLYLMKKSLAQNTAALPWGTTPASVQLATATEAAIANGTLLAAVGLIETTLQRQVTRYQLILSGGDALQIAESLSIHSLIDQSLIFKGLLCYCEQDRSVS